MTVPYYEGPPAETFEPPPPPLPKRPSRAPFVAAGVAFAAAVAVGAALAVARPWHHHSTPRAAAPVVHTPAAPTAVPEPSQEPNGPSLDHAAVEKLLIDFEDATAPVCNDAKDIAAKVGRTFTCVEGAQKWTVRITEVDPDGGVRYELVD